MNGEAVFERFSRPRDRSDRGGCNAGGGCRATSCEAIEARGAILSVRLWQYELLNDRLASGPVVDGEDITVARQ